MMKADVPIIKKPDEKATCWQQPTRTNDVLWWVLYLKPVATKVHGSL